MALKPLGRASRSPQAADGSSRHHSSAVSTSSMRCATSRFEAAHAALKMSCAFSGSSPLGSCDCALGSASSCARASNNLVSIQASIPIVELAAPGAISLAAAISSRARRSRARSFTRLNGPRDAVNDIQSTFCPLPDAPLPTASSQGTATAATTAAAAEDTAAEEVAEEVAEEEAEAEAAGADAAAAAAEDDAAAAAAAAAADADDEDDEDDDDDDDDDEDECSQGATRRAPSDEGEGIVCLGETGGRLWFGTNAVCNVCLDEASPGRGETPRCAGVRHSRWRSRATCVSILTTPGVLDRSLHTHGGVVTSNRHRVNKLLQHNP